MSFTKDTISCRRIFADLIVYIFCSLSWLLKCDIFFYVITSFQAIPFLLELRSVLDWVCTDTTLTLYHWLKMEDIYANIYVLKCYRESEKVRIVFLRCWAVINCLLGRSRFIAQPLSALGNTYLAHTYQYSRKKNSQ